MRKTNTSNTRVRWFRRKSDGHTVSNSHGNLLLFNYEGAEEPPITESELIMLGFDEISTPAEWVSLNKVKAARKELVEACRNYRHTTRAGDAAFIERKRATKKYMKAVQAHSMYEI